MVIPCRVLSSDARRRAPVIRILRGLASRRLPCGCLLGIYETYDGRVVTFIDARGEECGDRAHARDGQAIVEEPASTSASA